MCLWSADPIEGSGNSFAMIIRNQKKPFLSVLIRNVNDSADVSFVTINTSSSLAQPFAVIHLNTNIEGLYGLYMDCTPLVLTLPGGYVDYLPYRLAIYDATDDSPVTGSPFLIHRSDYKSIELLRQYKIGMKEERLKVASIAVELLDTSVHTTSGVYQANMIFEVRTI